MKSDTAIILLAAGSSSRMGSPKQLLEYRGRPLIRHAAETALAAGCGSVIVVLGAEAAAIRGALQGLGVVIVENPRWREGMGTSIQAGVSAAEAGGAKGVILALADQPLVTAEILANLVSTHEAAGQPIVASQYAGTAGVPVFFSRAYFPNLLALQPDQGCKGVILGNSGQALRIDCPEAEIDVDTPLDYQQVAQAAVPGTSRAAGIPGGPRTV